MIIYFSNTGTTKRVAQLIQEVTGDDLFEIEPKEPYSSSDLNWHNDNCRANQEQRDETSRPEILNLTDLDLTGEDTIYLGYPIWWGQAPRIIDTLVESADFSGKTIRPFCSSGSSPVGTSASNLEALDTSNAHWYKGHRFSAHTSKKEVEAWVKE